MVGSHHAHGGYKFSKILVFPKSWNVVIGNKCCWLFPWRGRFLVPSSGNACHTSESERPRLPAFLVKTVFCENKLKGQGLRRAARPLRSLSGRTFPTASQVPCLPGSEVSGGQCCCAHALQESTSV